MMTFLLLAGLLLLLLAIAGRLTINNLVTMIRFPVGLLTIVVVASLYLLLLPVEAALLMVALPFAAVTMSREAINRSWIGNFPNSLKGLSRTTSNLWAWVSADTEITSS